MKIFMADIYLECAGACGSQVKHGIFHPKIPALSKQLGAIKNNDVSKTANSGFSLKAEYILMVL